MYAKKYFELEDNYEKMEMINEIKKNETDVFDDIKDIIKTYIKNNIN